MINIISQYIQTNKSIVNQLQQINENLTILNKAISSQSFWNSQLFAAIIGASSAIIVLLIQQFWNWHLKRKEKLGEIYKWIAEQYKFWDPDSLFKNASSTIYECMHTNHVTGKTDIIPEKLLGEKMVIEFRSHVKYWTFPSCWLRRSFEKYENSLLDFNNCDKNDRNNLNILFSRSESVLNKIKDNSFKKTGENEWTI